MTPEQAGKTMQELLRLMVAKKGSDLFVADDFPPSIKIDGKLVPASQHKLTPQHTQAFAASLMSERQRQDFEREKECNFAIAPEGVGRFRVNVFYQQDCVSMVVRVIPTQIPTLDELKMPATLKDITMSRRGLVLMAGGTGSGKSTTLAAMINHRNTNAEDHIITIEDPVEFMHLNQRSLVSQREIGRDTLGWGQALKNTLRQAPDVIYIGEVRDRETMEYAIAFAETGHLCMATLHANNANQAIERVINFFPEDRRDQLLMDLSLNLRAVVSQRLARRADGKGRVAAVEVLMQTSTIADLIFRADIPGIKEAMAKSRELGMQTFDGALFDLVEAKVVAPEEALRHADSVNDLRLRLKLESKAAGETDPFKGADNLHIERDLTLKLGLKKKPA